MSNEQGDEHIHCIVLQNVHHFCIDVHLCMARNIAKESFELFDTEKDFLLFYSEIGLNDFLGKHVPQIWPIPKYDNFLDL
jgi:hypothetical protein